MPPPPDRERRARPRPSPRQDLTRLIVLLSALLAVVAVVGLARGGGGTEKTSATKPGPPPQLPRGGRALFPAWRVVAFAGAPQDPALGELGIGSLGGAVGKLERQAKSYARKTRPVLPALELIATIANADPGRDGRYSRRQPAATIDRHLRAARRDHALLVLDVQPGRATFPQETARLERWLREPDVALAIDPEWRMQHRGDVPGQVIGAVGAPELQQTFDAVARTVKRYRLPPKLVLVHRFTHDMLPDVDRVRVPPGVVPVMNIDGVGDRANKLAKYRDFTRDLPRGWRPGFKLFFHEDATAGGLMTPTEVMALRPRPDVVVYE